ncbi:MAG TPA: hypothetical protein PLS22_07420 [Aquabacterium sp.]|nr:hypothetical protein [Aquabacterium sp.]
MFLGAHCAYGQAGLRRRLIVRLHKILHTLGLAADLGPQCLFPTEVLKALVDELQAYLALVPGYAPRTAAFARVDADRKLSQVFYLPCCFLQQWEEEGDHHGHDWQDSADASPRQEDEAGDIEGHGPVEEHGGQVAG